MKKELEIGTLMSGAKFTLPLDLVTRTLAVIAIRGWGKTIAATVIAEEMCEAGLPWVAIDPVGVWWGLRCNPDGSPGGYPVVIIGGQHADLPLEKDHGAKVADAILQENLCCVIDMSGESKNAVRHFVGDFCDRLMELRPQVPRHIFFEEAPELVPQRPMGEQKRSLAAVDRLIRLGRNQGYGATLISQRYATIQKDVLTQCESLIAGRMIGKTDRVASEEWIGEVASSLFSNRKADKFVSDLAGLDSGHGWFLSPQWDNRFVEIQIRRRKTYHPGETRTVGQAPKQVQLSNVQEFVERFGKVLKATPAAVTSGTKQFVAKNYSFESPTVSSSAETLLRSQVAELSQKLGHANSIIASLRKAMEPDYLQLKALFGELDAAGANGIHADRSVWEPWIQKLGGRCGRMIESLLERGQLTRTQLATITEQSANSGSFATNLARLNTNGLIEKEGDKIKLKAM
jgi:hypothetical protein